VLDLSGVSDGTRTRDIRNHKATYTCFTPVVSVQCSSTHQPIKPNIRFKMFQAGHLNTTLTRAMSGL